MLYRAVLLLPVLACALPAQFGPVIGSQGTSTKAHAADYPAHAEAGSLALGADFMIHSFSGSGQTYIAKDYLVVEVALFIPTGKVLTLNTSQFALRVNGRKQPLSPKPAEFVASELRYPDWDNRSNAQMGVGPVVLGAPTPTARFPGDPQAHPQPVPPRAPADNPSGMESQPPVTADELVVRAALPEGEFHLPVSGYLYFPYKGKIKGIRSLELTFDGPTGKITMPLELTPR